MVTPATSHLDPPKSWEELEEICADLFSREWKDNNATRYGRQGQRQNGVDIARRVVTLSARRILPLHFIEPVEKKHMASLPESRIEPIALGV